MENSYIITLCNTFQDKKEKRKPIGERRNSLRRNIQKQNKRKRWYQSGMAVMLSFVLCAGSIVSVKAEDTVAENVEIEQTEYLTVPVKKEYVYHTFQLTQDPYSRYQWGLQNLGNLSYFDILSNGLIGKKIHTKAGIDIDLEEGLSYFQEKGANREIILAVIDTGIDTEHEDLQGHFWVNALENQDGKDSDNNGLKDDLYGWNFYDNNSILCDYDAYNQEYDEFEDDHGTHCAGTIVATANNHKGIAGIAAGANVKILPIKALGGEEGEDTGEGYTSSIVQAIEYAERMGAQICNLSFGGDGEDPVLKKVMKESDMLFICASGNDGRDIDKKPVYPAAYQLPNVISVANINGDGTLAASSNYGVQNVDLAAPGSEIISTLVGSNYGTMTGTSMAAPMVTGACALLYSFHNSMTAEDAKSLVLQSVEKLDTLTGKVKTGGMLNVNNLLRSSYEGTTEEGKPIISLKENAGKTVKKAKVTISVESKRDLEEVRVVKGNYTVEDFQKGSLGTKLKNKKSQTKWLAKGATYTVYVRDRAGMEQVSKIKVSKATAKQIKATEYQSKIALLR